MKWGLVPHWSKEEDKTLKTINARSENLVEGGGMWASIKGRKRCVVVCEGYYEWLKKGKERLPHFTKHKDGRLMLLAGLYDSVILEGHSDTLWTFTIVTTSANKAFSWLHDRQPVILSTHEALTAWLDTSSHTWSTTLTKLVDPYDNEKSPLTWYLSPTSCKKLSSPKRSRKVGTESPTFIQPIADRKDGIQAMFAKQTKSIASTSAPSTPSKGKKRERDSEVEAKTTSSDEFGSPADKKPKIEKLDTWEDHSEIEYLDTPLQSQIASNHDGGSDKPSNRKMSPQKQRKKAPKQVTKQTGKITAFFKK
ncbi:hypothetical protein QCA50_008022 [Cerrena zonata]|uniref:DUF159-domain-containing protein n=1 Tax=Cerrena zonata TaxID=2478898 RepID=A0AAW0GA16_9APHY